MQRCGCLLWDSSIPSWQLALHYHPATIAGLQCRVYAFGRRYEAVVKWASLWVQEMHIGVNAQEALGYYRKIVAAITAAVKQSTQPHTPPTSTHAPAKK